MTEADLIPTAIEFRNAKLWNRLSESEVIAIRRPGGKTDYICVMGSEGVFTAVSAFRGAMGLSSLFNLIESGDGEEEVGIDGMFSQDCVMCSFEDRGELDKADRDLIRAAGIAVRGRKAWPVLRSYKPDLCPMRITDGDDLELLYLSMKAGLEFSRKLPSPEDLPTDSPAFNDLLETLGFGEGMVPLCEWNGESFTWGMEKLGDLSRQFPAAEIGDELELARLRALPRDSSRVYYLKLAILPIPIDADPPFLPTMPLFIDSVTGPVSLANAVNFSRDEDKAALLEMILNYIKQNGRPIKIVLAGRRAADFLTELLTKIGIPAVREDDNLYLTKYHEELSKSMLGEFPDSED